jgi:hypothetical protein
MTDQLTENCSPAVALVDPAPPPTAAPEPARPAGRLTNRPARRPAGWAVATTVVVAVAAATAGWTVHVGQERHETVARQATVRAALRHASADLARVTADVDAVRTQSAAEARTLTTLNRQLAAVKARMSQDQAGQLIEATTVAALDTCLGGVEAAVNQTAVGDGTGAAQSLVGVAASCQTVQGGAP